MDNKGYFAKVTAFFNSYLAIPESHFEQNGILSSGGMQICARYLIDLGVFEDKNDMKAEALKTFNIILPDWIFKGA